jgi:CHAP domain
LVRTKYWKHFVMRTGLRVWQAFAAWLFTGAALITPAVSWAPQPAAAATSQAPAARLVIPAAVQRHLLALYAAYRHIPVTDIAWAAPGPVLGARLRRSGEDWAMIHWEPSSRAPQRAAAGFQDGASTGIFTRALGGVWTVAGLGGEPAGCAVSIPRAVRRSWHLASCQALETPSSPPASKAAAAGTTGDLVKIARAQVGVSDNPPVRSFNDPDCDPYTTLVGNPLGASGKHCKTSSNGSYFHNVQDVNEFWCADFTKWVWEQAGVTSGLGVLTPSAATFYTWGTDHGEHISFRGTPKVGDAVILYPPGTKAPDGSYADHVGIVTTVNSGGTVNLVNGDFLGSANISVQYNTHVHLSRWASRVEGTKGEKWAFVSPLLKARAPQPADGAHSEPAVYGSLSGSL